MVFWAATPNKKSNYLLAEKTDLLYKLKRDWRGKEISPKMRGASSAYVVTKTQIQHFSTVLM